MKNSEERTQRITAYLLGELSELDRVALERELEGDAELRAEKERLAATIGLVQGALGKDARPVEALSATSQDALLAAARAKSNRAGPQPTTPWYASRGLRLAAGFVVLFGAGVFATRALMKGEEGPAPLFYQPFGGGSTETASGRATADLRAKTEAPPATLDEEQREALSSLGYSDSSDGPLPKAENEELARALGSTEHVGGRAPQPAEPARDSLEQLEALGYLGGGGGGAPAESATSPSAPQIVIGIGGGAGGGTFGKRMRGGGRPRSAPGASGAVTGEDTWFLGHGVKPQGRQAGGEGTSGPASPVTRSAELSDGDVAHLRDLYARGELSAEEVDAVVAGEAKEKDRLNEEEVELLRKLGYVQPLDERRDEADRIFSSCVRLPNESPSAMFFRFWGDNAFELAALDRLSTFSVDVDTASYTLARRYLSEGRVPEKAQVRTEEFVNYFDAEVEPPSDKAFAIHMDLAPSRFGGDDRERWMMRVALQGREVADFERDPVALTFVVDTSGSMNSNNRIELVKTSLRLLLTKLDANDAVAIVAFSNEARLVLPMTSAANRDTIEMALAQLQPTGGTNAESGLKLGYAHASDSLTKGASNRVIFLSDGVANIGQTDQDRLNEDVARFRDRGIYLNTVGVGFGNHNDVFLEQLADKGNGICDYVDTALEARKAFVENFTGKLQTIARDVKIQVEFDPASVVRYRLLGYENRAIADSDFRNDTVDAGEIGAGHQVTALYELELANLGSADSDLPLATTRVRWKTPYGEAPEGRDPEQAFEVARTLSSGDVAASFEATPIGYQKAVVVAQFAEFLRRSIHARGDSLDDLIAEAANISRRGDEDADFRELTQLLSRSRELILSNLPRYDDLRLAVDAYRRNQVLRAQLEDLASERDADVLRDLERQNAELEQRIRDLLAR